MSWIQGSMAAVRLFALNHPMLVGVGLGAAGGLAVPPLYRGARSLVCGWMGAEEELSEEKKLAQAERELKKQKAAKEELDLKRAKEIEELKASLELRTLEAKKQLQEQELAAKARVTEVNKNLEGLKVELETIRNEHLLLKEEESLKTSKALVASKNPAKKKVAAKKPSVGVNVLDLASGG